MSGASPWYITPDAEGNPVQIMIGASIEETRTDIDASINICMDNRNLTLKPSLGYTTENDYNALSGGLELVLDFNNKLSTFNVGLGFSSDKVTPTDSDFFHCVLIAKIAVVLLYF